MLKSFYVYLIIDPRDSQPFYVGKGKNRRMYQHKLDSFNSNQNFNNPIQNRIREILSEGYELIYEKVVIGVGEIVAFNKEREWISKIGRASDGTGTLLNQTAGGQGMCGIGDEQKASRRQKSSKPVCQYSLDGSFIAEWPSAKVAAEHTPANRSYITQVCKGKRKSAGGFLWTYKGNPLPLFSKNYYRSVQQLDITGTVLSTFRSLTEAQLLTGVELHNISECCRGKSKTAGGYVWRYTDTLSM